MTTLSELLLSPVELTLVVCAFSSLHILFLLLLKLLDVEVILYHLGYITGHAYMYFSEIMLSMTKLPIIYSVFTVICKCFCCSALASLVMPNTLSHTAQSLF